MNTWQMLKKDPKLWQKLFIREKIVESIREFFKKRNFHEVETPLVVPEVIPESYLEYFETYLLDRNRNKRKVFLTTSPEASIKKLLVAGIGNCFEITKSFRNTETQSYLHNPEFTILEWYRVGATYKDIMEDCERLMKYILAKVKTFNNQRSKDTKTQKANTNLSYQGKKIDLSSPWERISVIEALDKYAYISFDEITNPLKFLNSSNTLFPGSKIARVARSKGYKIEAKNTWEEIFNQIFLNEIQPHLGTGGRPTIVYDYPAPMAALAKLKKTDNRLAERFEFYISGLELGNCFTELTDYRQQKRIFDKEMNLRYKLGKIKVKPDNDFLVALKTGLPDCAGIAVGIDRLVMLFTDSESISDALLFPMN